MEDAQKAIDNQELDAVTNKELREGLVQDIAMLYDIAQSLHDARFKDGAMSQMRDELTFEFDENGEPVTFGIKKPHASSMIIKEFSLLANRSVAQKISSQFPEQALLRRHAPPNKRKIVSKVDIVSMETLNANARFSSSVSFKSMHSRVLLSLLIFRVPVVSNVLLNRSRILS